jgi:aldehyde dehydrogenase (NAD+)
MQRRHATRHDRFDAMPIDGRWRPGGAGKRGLDRDPFTDGVIAEIPLADAGDVDDAYRDAERAQSAGAQRCHKSVAT